MIVNKVDLIGADGNKFYANGRVHVIASSPICGPSAPKMYRRNGYLEDPWVSARDHTHPGGHNIMMYGEAGNGHHSNILRANEGMNVFIR